MMGRQRERQSQRQTHEGIREEGETDGCCLEKEGRVDSQGMVRR